MFLQTNTFAMSDHSAYKNKILSINTDVMDLIRSSRANMEMSNSAFYEWIYACQGIQNQLANDLLRVAVIGTIKSGKSTFVNSLFRGDYLKRGAGVVTSIVTRIRKGPHLKARLHFKSWGDVNAEMVQALTLFPTMTWDAETHPFDIRRGGDRETLQTALNSLGSEQLITNDTRNVNSVLLGSYLKGYARVERLIGNEQNTKVFEKDDFQEHRKFVSNDHLAVFLRDVQIEIGESLFDSHIEIADCQGSDSSNPLHLAMIQDYLLMTHLLIYVVSSRTGLRQADIRFLSIIKKMGILENTIFVINCDFSEHDSLDEFHLLNTRIKEELSIILPQPKVFSFSALYNLFQAQTGVLLPKDQLRVAQWEQETAFIEYSKKATGDFEKTLQFQLSQKRHSLLLANHLYRLRVIADGMAIVSRTHQDLLGQDRHSVQTVIKKIAYHQKKMDQVRSLIKSTLDGAIQALKKELKDDIDRFFDVRSGDVIPGLLDLIRNYTIPLKDQRANLNNLGITKAIYLVYQEFKQTVDTYMAETLNPDTIGFLKQQEEKIKTFLESVASPYNTMVKDAIAEYIEAMDKMGIEMGVTGYDTVSLPDLNTIKTMAGLRIPPAMAMMRYSARIKTDAIMRYGFYQFFNAVKRIFKKKNHLRDNTLQALADGLKRIKHETELSVLFHLKSYRENIKYQYIFKVLDAAAQALCEALGERFQAYHTDLSKISALVGKKQEDKVRLARFWQVIETNSEKLVNEVNTLLQDIEAV